MNPAFIVLAVACGVAVLISLASLVWVLRYSTVASIHDATRKIEDVQHDWVAYKASIESVMNAIESQLDSVERKRRQISGAASRLNAKEGASQEPAAPPSRQEILAPFRRAAFGQK